MEQNRLSVDGFSPNRQPYQNRRPVYARRQLHTATISDMVSVRKPRTVAKSAVARKVSVDPTRQMIVVPVRAKQHKDHVPVVEQKSSHRRFVLSKQQVVLYAMAAVVFIVGLGVSLNGFKANRQVAAQVKQQQAVDAPNDANQTTAPSTVKPTAAVVATYAVAPNLPKYIDIPKLGVHARTLSMGVNSKNQLQAPGNVYDAGWYNASAQPGQPGSMLIDGHVSSWTTHGVFYGLNKLGVGDAISVTRGDGKVFTYTIVKTALLPSANVDMASLLVSQNTAKPGLSLISCAGDVIAGTNEFDKRQIIYAVMQ